MLQLIFRKLVGRHSTADEIEEILALSVSVMLKYFLGYVVFIVRRRGHEYFGAEDDREPDGGLSFCSQTILVSVGTALIEVMDIKKMQE